MKKNKSATTIILILNIIIFIITLGGNILTNVFGNFWYYTFLKGQIYRLITCTFLHSGIMHILCNSISLIQLGYGIEYLYGKKKFLMIYFISGIGSSFCSAFINMLLSRNIMSVGASGAICGLIGIMLANLKEFQSKNLDKNTDKITNIILILLPIIIIGFNPGVDNIAHFSGVAIGYILGRIIKKRTI